MSKTIFSKRTILSFLFISALSVSKLIAQMTFIHPGALNSKADLGFVKAKIEAEEEPWLSAFNSMKSYARPGSYSTAPSGESSQKSDGQRAYANALAWYYTGEATMQKMPLKY